MAVYYKELDDQADATALGFQATLEEHTRQETLRQVRIKEQVLRQAVLSGSMCPVCGGTTDGHQKLVAWKMDRPYYAVQVHFHCSRSARGLMLCRECFGETTLTDGVQIKNTAVDQVYRVHVACLNAKATESETDRLKREHPDLDLENLVSSPAEERTPRKQKHRPLADMGRSNRKKR